MSGLGRVPSFEPDEEAKALIESMFEQKQEVKKEEKKKSETTEPIKRHRVRIPEPPPQTEKQQEIAMNLAKEELDIIHDAFMDFSEVVSDTVVYGYLYNEVLKLTEAFQDMETMLLDKVNKDEMTEAGLADYEKMRKIRGRVLNDVYNKYGEGK